jgi:hypothetical protein
VKTDPWKYRKAIVAGSKDVKNFHCLTYRGEEYFMGLIQMVSPPRVYDTPRLVAPIGYDHSKKHMFRFHYSLRRLLDWNTRFAYTDTDSLIYQVKLQTGRTILDMMNEWNEKYGAKYGYFDRTGFLGFDGEGDPIKCEYAGALGSFKIEHGAPGDEIKEVICLAAKLFAVLKEDPSKKPVLHAKGLPMFMVSRDGFQAYKNALDGAPRLIHEMLTFKNVDMHSTQTVLRRAGVTHSNDKVIFWLEYDEGSERCRYVTLPHGYVGDLHSDITQKMVISQAPFAQGFWNKKNGEWEPIFYPE